MSITVLKPGLLTTIQDLGRPSYQVKGIGISGALDTFSHRVANWLVGNCDNAATIEVTLLGPKLFFLCPAVIAICGADLSPCINGKPIENGRPIQILSGDTLSFSGVIHGCRSYIAVHGGIQVPLVFGSRSTDIRSKIGGINGRQLKSGDTLTIKPSHLSRKMKRKVSPSLFSHVHANRKIKFTRGKQFDYFSRSSQLLFSSSLYQVHSHSNRMGTRLSGPKLTFAVEKDLTTEGVSHGSVQVPPNGQPIILTAERQTTGGYPKIAQISAVDLSYLAQRKPGDSISFEEVSLELSQSLYMDQEKQLKVLKKVINLALEGVINS